MGVKDTYGEPHISNPLRTQRIEIILICLRDKRAGIVMKMSHEVDVPKSSLRLILNEKFEFRK